MNTRKRTTSLLLGILLLTGTGLAQAQTPAMPHNGVLTDAAGMTLYVFDRDITNPGKSVCNGACATNWPPLLAKDDALGTGDYSVVTRDDGKKQWAFKGKPLYYWAKDQKPGDMSGDGVNNSWHTVKP